MPSYDVNLPDRLINFVESQVDSGRFKNISEVHCAALTEMRRKEEERQTNIKQGL